MDLKSIFTRAHNLQEAALLNRPRAVSKFMGNAAVGNLDINSEALRIAAENGSYDAFERILEISRGVVGAVSPVDFALGKDWDRVQDLTKKDSRLAQIMQEHEKKYAIKFQEFEDGFKAYMRDQDAHAATQASKGARAPASNR